MGILIRAVVSGFGFSLGSALFRKVSKRLGLDEEKNAPQAEPSVADDGEVDDELEEGDAT